VTDDDAEVSIEHQSGEMEMEGTGHGYANQRRAGIVLARRSADRSKVRFDRGCHKGHPGPKGRL